MRKVWKTVLGLSIGLGAATGAAYAAYKAKCEMDAMPDETGNGMDKTKQWLKMKKDSFKDQIDEKNEQIAEIVENLKSKLIDEQIPEVRKELMEKASEQIHSLKSEIKEIMHTRSKELSAIAHKISDSELLQELTDLIGSVDKAAKKKLRINKDQNNTRKCCCEPDDYEYEPVSHYHDTDACCCDSEEFQNENDEFQNEQEEFQSEHAEFRSEIYNEQEETPEETPEENNEVPVIFDGEE